MWCSDALSLLSVCRDTDAENTLALQRVFGISCFVSGCLIYAFSLVSLRLQLQEPRRLLTMCYVNVYFPNMIFCAASHASHPYFQFKSMEDPPPLSHTHLPHPKKGKSHLVKWVSGSARCLQPCFCFGFDNLQFSIRHDGLNPSL